jgi:hypothetical protein
MSEYITAEVKLSDTIQLLSDQERIQWITALLETISEEGTIETVRALVNETRWND